MAEPGEVIVNPATGERIEFRETKDTTGGRLLEFELTLAPCGRLGGLPHKHEVTERLTIHAGTLSAWIGLVRRDIGPGESVTVPAGLSHYVFNDDSDEEVRATVEVRPSRDFETFFETVFAIAAKRRYKAFRGLPRPLHICLLAYTYGVYGPLVPIALQRPLLAPLAALARLRGYPPAVDPTPVWADRADSGLSPA
jgi:mannose-6-phosphate isomerase-like protein (cupin superfamily)